MTLYIGDKIFYTEGYNRQNAKHTAAYQAVQYLSSLKLPEKTSHGTPAVVDITVNKEESEENDSMNYTLNF